MELGLLTYPPDRALENVIVVGVVVVAVVVVT
jgi:hypothetical protein